MAARLFSTKGEPQDQQKFIWRGPVQKRTARRYVDGDLLAADRRSTSITCTATPRCSTASTAGEMVPRFEEALGEEREHLGRARA